MAGPIRFRHSTERWNEDRVRRDLLSPLADTFGAELNGPWFAPPEGWAARRLEMDNGDLALFIWNGQEAYWLGNTQTPETLWRTDKRSFERSPDAIAEWAQRELLAQLEVEDPWLTEYEALAHFFLPVFLSKDGRESTRTFFRDHASGFPDAGVVTEERLRGLAAVLREQHGEEKVRERLVLGEPGVLDL